MPAHDPAGCPDCRWHTATADSGHRAAAVNLCPAGRAEADQAYADARAENPEIAELHRMIGLTR